MKSIVAFYSVGIAIIAAVWYTSAQAQLVDVRVDGAKSRSVGVIPRMVDEDTFRVRTNWVPGSLAVYRDGLRCLYNSDYVVRNRDIIFEEGTTSLDSVVQVDYEPR